MTYNIRGIPHQYVEKMWHFAEPYVKRALDHAAGELEPQDIKQGCLDREIQLWLISQGQRVVGACTTEIVIYSHKKHCRIITIAGSQFDEWIGMVDELLVQWATSLACDALEAHVRKGFVKKLSLLKYKHLHSVVIKKLDIIPQQGVVEVQDGQKE